MITKILKYIFTCLAAIATGVLVAIGVMAFTGPSTDPPIDSGSYAPIPSGLIALFSGDCPTGWTEYTAARGRFLVGVPLGGTNASATGTALTNLGARTITDVPSHLHAIDPPATVSGTSGNHSHGPPADGKADAYVVYDNAAGYVWGASGGTAFSASVNTGAAGSHGHTTDIAQFDSASTGSASVDVTMPYIQLRCCEKN